MGMNMQSGQEYKLRFYDLPLCRLHVLEAGSGPPLVIVPATISECKDWVALARFMAQWFHVYFFELPGHGESTPFRQPFSTSLVAETVEQLLDLLGIQRFHLMGFSFGGILAMKTFQRLEARVDGVILIAPCLTQRAVTLSRTRTRLVLAVNWFLGRPRNRKAFLRLLHNPRSVDLMIRFLQRLGRIESTIKLRPKLLTISESTLEVLGCQINEILTIEFSKPEAKHATLCFLAMSVNDPVLDFETTLAVAQAHFERVQVFRTSEPYHQPPEPFTYEGLNREYYETVEEFLKRQGSS
jgi:predicted alpha/beta hydrolase family esterase